MKQKTAAQHKLGTAPGSVTYTGTKKEDSITISGWIYDDKSVEPINIDLKQLPVPQKGKKIWIQVEGLHDIALIKKFGEHFKIHNLFLEDICNIHRNTSMDFIDPFVGIHLRHLSLEDDVISGLPLSVLANDNIVISFTETQEHPDLLTPIEERLLDSENPLRTKPTYYLQYVMLDLVVDHYLLILYHLEQELEILDEDISDRIESSQLDALHLLRKQLLRVRKPSKSIGKVLEALPDNLPKIDAEALDMYFHDTAGHLRSIIENIRNDTEKLSSLFDLYFTMVSLRMNQAMQFLAVITVIFLPLTLLTGIYGMNFSYMPGLSWRHGFWLLIGIMAFCTIGALLFFKKKRWF